MAKNKKFSELKLHMAESQLVNSLNKEIDQLNEHIKDDIEVMGQLLDIASYAIGAYEKFLHVAKGGGPHIPYLATAQLEIVKDMKNSIKLASVAVTCFNEAKAKEETDE